jgi:hypothetical protein
MRRTSYTSLMPAARTHVRVKGDYGVRLGHGDITIDVWDKKDRKVGSVTIGQSGVQVKGKTHRKPALIKWDDSNP